MEKDPLIRLKGLMDLFENEQPEDITDMDVWQHMGIQRMISIIRRIVQKSEAMDLTELSMGT